MEKKSILCRLGIHKGWPEDNNFFTPNEVVLRTYMRCTRCKKWGKMTFFEVVQIKDELTSNDK